MNKITGKISFNSPAVLTIVFVSALALFLGEMTGGYTTRLLFSSSRDSLFNPLFYMRLFTHIFGHADFEHFSGNMMYILLVGPLLEEKYGQKNIFIIAALTAVITAVIHVVFFPDTMILGASGVVFAFIILASVTSVSAGKIPVTFIIMSAIYIGGQIFQGIFIKDNISNISHIVGGIVGAVCGYNMRRR
ncbi:MAG: rhomboid family intramembrane serine protease [Oscillospiraceae bacterium]|nr:rhomboid family intramembrane serine protease [Oscillospiraceae bacterium]